MAEIQYQLKPLNVINLRDHITSAIFNMIIDGIYSPGERLVESIIAEQLCVSQAPVREALAAIERDGIVSYFPRRGFFVNEFTDKDIEEIYSIRSLLEVGAARRAINRLTEEDFVNLQLILMELDESIRSGVDLSRRVDQDFMFHEYICKAADHGRLYSAWLSMRMQTMMLIGFTAPSYGGCSEDIVKKHQVVLEALKAKKVDVITKLIYEQFEDAKKRVLMAIKKNRVDNQI